MERRYNEITRRVLCSKYADWFLGFISFTESSFLPILIDPFQVLFTVARPERWLRYAIVASVGSVLGGIAGYILGALFFDLIGERIIEIYGLQSQFASTAELLGKNAFVMTLIGAITPVPYKIVAIVGGFLNINLLVFILASVLGRSVRFFVVGFLAKKLGEQAHDRFVRNVNIVTALVIVGIIVYVLYKTL